MNYIVFSLVVSVYVVLAELLIFISKEHTYMALFSVFYLLLVALFSKRLFILVSFLVLVVNSAIFHIAFHWGREIVLFERIQVALLSPPTEIKEYLQNSLGWIDLVEAGYFLVGLILLYHYIKKAKNEIKRLRYISLVVFVLITFILYKVGYLNKIIPYRYIEHYMMATSWKTQMKERSDFIKQSLKKRKLKKYIYDKVVLVIGESANKHHMSLYGYKYPTTRFLSSLVKKDFAEAFDVISPANQTRLSIPVMLSYASVKDFNKYMKSKSLVSLFREVGYKSYWLSNQFKVGEYDTYISSLANEADFHKIKNLHFILEQAKVKPDEVLLEDVDKCYKKSQREFFVLHLMGSHAMYDKRYPKDKAYFKPPKDLIQAYDNTIYYTDIFLKELFDRFKDDKVLFIYVSDHSEVPGTQTGHGFVPSYKDEYEIPFVVYSSVPNERLKILKNKNLQKKFNLESLINIVKYLTYMDDKCQVSYSQDVMSVSPSRVVNYKDLKYYKKK